MASETSPTSLLSLYREATNTLKQLEEGEITVREGNFKDVLSKVISQFKQCLAIIERLSLFSPNEEVEDVPTAHLKYTLVPYQLAMAYMKIEDIDTRVNALKAAKSLLKNFLKNCSNLGLLSDAEIEVSKRDKEPKADDLRVEKLERFKAKKALEAKQAALNSRRTKASTQQVGASQVNEENYDEEGEYEREWSILLIELAVKSSLDELSMLDREIEILGHMAAIKTYGKAAVEANLPPPTPGWEGIMTPEGPLKTFVIDKKMQIRAATFKPSWNLPTMTVEQAGEIEAKLAHERSKKEAESKARAEANKLSESDEENDDAALKKAREWDQFKDDTPFGSGNTGNKGYIYK